MKATKKLLALFLALCMILSIAVIPAAAAEEAEPFTDVDKTDWFYDAVCYVYANGLMKGISDTTFAPNRNDNGGTVTRAMVVTILYRLNGTPKLEDEKTAFTDINGNGSGWYRDAVLWAEDNGIAKGITETRFAPNDYVTRQQMATFLYRYCKTMGHDASASAPLDFKDAATVTDYAKEAMSWAVGAGIMKGSKEGSEILLMPKANTSRAELATMLMRFCEGLVPTPVEPDGTKEHPYPIVEDKENKAELKAGQTLYYYGRLSELIMTIENAADATVELGGEKYTADENGVITVVFPEADPREPAVFSITSTKDAAYVMNFAYPVGHMMNPETITGSGSYTAAIEKDDEDGYFYTFTAPAKGTLDIEISGETWSYVINNETTGKYGEWKNSKDNADASHATVEVAAGDVISVNVSTYDPAAYPAGEVTLSVTYTVKHDGTEEDPLPILEDAENKAELKAGQTLYYTGNLSEMIMTIENAANATVELSGEKYTADENGVITVVFPESDPRNPTVFSITSTTDAAYVMNFAYPVGHMMNPHPIAGYGVYTTTIEEGDEDGYFYTYTADFEGKLRVAFSGESWSYVINNVTTGTYGDWMNSVDNADKAVAVVEVAKGDEIRINVNTYDSKNPFVYPAGEVDMDISFSAASGSEGNPYSIYLDDNEAETTEESVEIAAGASVYYGLYHASGCDLTIADPDAVVTFKETEYAAVDGVVTVPIVSSNEGVALILKNNGTTAKTFTLNFKRASGNKLNPIVLTTSEEDKISGSADLLYGYLEEAYFTWTAPKDGTLYVYADCEVADSIVKVTVNGSAKHEGMAVTEGTAYTICVTATNAYGVPAQGKINLNGSLLAALGSEENPIFLDDISKAIKAPVGANETVYYQGRLGGETLTIKDAANAKVTYNGTEYTPDEQGVITVAFPATEPGDRNPMIFSITSTVEATYVLDFGYVSDTIEETMTVEITEAVEEGVDKTWTAPATGRLTVTIESEDNWFYSVTNVTTGVSSDIYYFDTNEPTMTIDVAEGDEIKINVNVLDASGFNVGTGTVVINLSLAPAGNPEETIPVEITTPSDEGVDKTWTAPAAGKLTVTIESEDNWFYSVTNMTTGVASDGMFFVDGAEPTMTIDVAKGDEIKINVNVYDESGWNADVGTINIVISFVPAE